jgi:hypothetical protein
MEVFIIAPAADIEHLEKEVHLRFVRYAFGKMMDKMTTKGVRLVFSKPLTHTVSMANGFSVFGLINSPR